MNPSKEEFHAEHLKLWTMPDSYFGAEWPDYYVFLGQNRDSDALTRSNFSEGLKRIGGESDTVKVIHEGHWAVGWVEWIAIHRDDTTALNKAEDILDRLKDYPVISEEAYYELKYKEFSEYVLSELDGSQAQFEQYLDEAGHIEGTRGETIDEIDWDVLQRVKDEHHNAGNND